MGLGAVTGKAPLLANELPLKEEVKDGLVSTTSVEEFIDVQGSKLDETETVSITVVGASGDLAKKKIFPALFALYYEDCLPKVRFV